MPTVGALSKQRKRYASLLTLGASAAGLVVMLIAGSILLFPLVDAYVLPWLLRTALVSACTDGVGMRDGIHSSHDSVDVRAAASGGLLAKLDAYDRQGAAALIVLTGDAAVGKSSVARRLHGQSKRPGLYVSMRGVETVQDGLFTYLYYLLSPVGLPGKFVIAYVKLLNAFMDLWSMNQVRCRVCHLLCCSHGGRVEGRATNT